jgi:hypothetical protein
MSNDYMAVFTARPREVIDVEGIKIEVRGLSLGEARKIGDDTKTSGIMAIVASCFIDDKPAFTRADVEAMMPKYVHQIDEAIGRVNGYKPGN